MSMKSIKNKIICFSYNEKVTDRNNKLLLQEINKTMADLDEKKTTGVFISFKQIVYELNSIKQLIRLLCLISRRINVPLAIGDYSPQLFPILKEETKESCIKLFRTFDIANLFLNTKTFGKNLNILMLDNGEDEEELYRQASMLTKYEHKIIYTKDKNEFAKKLKDDDIDYAISQTKLNLAKTSKDKLKINFLLSRNLVVNLPVFTDISVEHLETLTGLKATKTAHAISFFNEDIGTDIVSAIMKFKGDIDGTFVLIFPKSVALIAIEAMLGEEIEVNDAEGINDGIAEFCNIITGGTKTALSKKDIKITYDLPKTYDTIEATKGHLPKNSGIWINMKLEDNPFYMYIIK